MFQLKVRRWNKCEQPFYRNLLEHKGSTWTTRGFFDASAFLVVLLPDTHTISSWTNNELHKHCFFFRWDSFELLSCGNLKCCCCSDTGSGQVGCCGQLRRTFRVQREEAGGCTRFCITYQMTVLSWEVRAVFSTCRCVVIKLYVTLCNWIRSNPKTDWFSISLLFCILDILTVGSYYLWAGNDSCLNHWSELKQPSQTQQLLSSQTLRAALSWLAGAESRQELLSFSAFICSSVLPIFPQSVLCFSPLLPWEHGCALCCQHGACSGHRPHECPCACRETARFTASSRSACCLVPDVCLLLLWHCKCSSCWAVLRREWCFMAFVPL